MTSRSGDIATRALVSLWEEALRHRDPRWVLFVSFVCPSFPPVARAAGVRTE